MLKKLVYPFFFIKSRKRELFFAFAAKITFSDTGTFSKIIFDLFQNTPKWLHLSSWFQKGIWLGVWTSLMSLQAPCTAYEACTGCAQYLKGAQTPSYICFRNQLDKCSHFGVFWKRSETILVFGYLSDGVLADPGRWILS